MKKAQLGIKEIVYLALGLLVLLLGFIAYNNSETLIETITNFGSGTTGELDDVSLFGLPFLTLLFRKK